MRENQEAREKQALLERREQLQAATKRRGSGFKLFSRSSKNMEEEIKREFEAKSKPRKIDVKALEESRKEKAKQSSESQQKDFRHLLKRADQPRSKKGAGTKSGEKRRSKGDSDEQPHKSKHLHSNLEKKLRAHPASTQGAAELTGSWDYIPSPPSSTVDLLANQQDQQEEEEEEEEGRAQERRRGIQTDFYHQEDEMGSGYEQEADWLVASAPVLDLQGTAGYLEPAMDWDANTRTSGGQKRSQDFDYETQF